MRGRGELLEPLPVGGQLVELLAMEALGKPQIRGAGRDLVLLTPDTNQ
jgi:hypothetical protein